MHSESSVESGRGTAKVLHGNRGTERRNWPWVSPEALLRPCRLDSRGELRKEGSSTHITAEASKERLS